MKWKSTPSLRLGVSEAPAVYLQIVAKPDRAMWSLHNLISAIPSWIHDKFCVEKESVQLQEE